MKNSEKSKFGYNEASGRIVFLNQVAFDTMLKIATDLEKGEQDSQEEWVDNGEVEWDQYFEEMFKDKFPEETFNQNNIKRILIQELLLCNETHEKLREKNEGTNALLVDGSECPACQIGVLRTDRLKQQKCEVEEASDPDAAQAFAKHILAQNLEGFKKIQGG